MTGDGSYPPPGSTPPGGPPPPGMLGAAHKPGAIALRPLGLGDIYDGAFRIIRFNPKATVGSAVLVAAVSMAVPVLLAVVLTALVDFTAAGDTSDAQALADLGYVGSLGIGTFLQSIGVILVTGMIAHVAAAAATGRRLSLGEAWAATHGSRWRLVGLTLLLGLMIVGIVTVYVVLWVVVALLAPTALVVVFGIVTVPTFLVFLVWFWIRVYYLPVPALMLERIGVVAAIGRGFRLTSRQFWRTLGIALLTVVITGIAGSVLAVPFSIGSAVAQAAMAGSQYVVLVSIVLTALGTVVQTAFVTPFTAAVTSLQYLDQRMRKEAYDVELMARAGIASP